MRVRFALGFNILVALFLAFAFIFVYVSFANFRKDEFYKRLRDRALTTFKLLVEVEQIDNNLLRVIDQNTLNSWYDEKVLIFKDSTLVYSSIDDTKIKYIPDLLKKAKDLEEYRTVQGNDEVIALYVEQKPNHYILLASAYDRYGISKMNFLKWVMIAVYFFGLLIAWLSTYFFVKKVMRPLEKFNITLANMDYNNLDLQLIEKGQGEEVDSLSTTFNEMLARLRQSVNFQKDFVHYASHELRTPLAAMVSLTENAMQKTLDAKETQEILKELFQQQRNLTDITNSLLVLSDSKRKPNELSYPKIRLDELIFRSVDITKNLYPDAHIEIDFEGEVPNESSLLIDANEALMLMAFNNLLKNAFQYSSDKHVRVIMYGSQKLKEIRFINSGRAFAEDEEERIFTPFYRASNAALIDGHGLGLPLVRHIVQLHSANISYHHSNGFNEFKIVFL